MGKQKLLIEVVLILSATRIPPGWEIIQKQPYRIQKQLKAQKQSLQVMQIRLETLGQLDCVKQFLEMQEKAMMLSNIVQTAEAAEGEGDGQGVLSEE